MSAIHQEIAHNSPEAQKSLSLNFEKQEFDGMLYIKDELVLEESKEFQNVTDASKDIIHEFIDQNKKFLSREDFLIECHNNIHSIKSEENGNESPHKFSEFEAEIELKEEEIKKEKCNYILTKKDSGQLKSRKYECNHCDYGATLKSGLPLHIDSVHLKVDNHECHLCDYSALHKARLQSHIDDVHLKLRKYKCYLCDYSDSKKFVLRQHMNSVHLKLKNHKCHLCGYRAFQENHLQLTYILST